MKRFLFGFLWAFVLYFGACVVTGAVVGATSAGTDPKKAAEVGSRAAARTVGPLRPYFAVGAIVLAVIGASQGVLPGTRN